MSFANQASPPSTCKNGGSLDRRVYVVPEDIDKKIARLELESLDVNIDTLTDLQKPRT